MKSPKIMRCLAGVGLLCQIIAVLAVNPASHFPPAVSSDDAGVLDTMFAPVVPTAMTLPEQSNGQSDVFKGLGEKSVWVQSLLINGLVKRPGIDPISINRMAQRYLAKEAEDKNDAGSVLIKLKKIDNIAKQTLQYYRSKGYVLTQVYFPEQNIDPKGAKVILQVREPVLGQIKIKGKTIFSGEQLVKPFVPYFGKPVLVQSIQHAVFKLRSYPGLTVNTVLNPREQDSQTALLLDIKHAPRFEAEIKSDNYGAKTSGRYHGGLKIKMNNPFNHLDQASVEYSHNLDPEKGGTWTAIYQTPWHDSFDTLLGGQLVDNHFDLTANLAGSGLSGEYKQGQAYLKHFFKRSEMAAHSMTFAFIRQRSDVCAVGNTIKRDDLAAIKIDLESSKAWPALNARTMLQLSFTRGLPHVFESMGDYNSDGLGKIPPSQSGSGKYATGEYSRTNLNFNVARSLPWRSTLLWRVIGQYSPNFLTSLERYGLGGSSVLRAYDSDYMVDSSLVTALDWRVPVLLKRLESQWRAHLSALLFADYGKGWVHHPNAFERTNKVNGIDLYNLGVGVTADIKKRATLQFQVGIPLDGAPRPQDKKNLKYWATLVLNVL